jgi:hypothetical protein
MPTTQGDRQACPIPGLVVDKSIKASTMSANRPRSHRRRSGPRSLALPRSCFLYGPAEYTLGRKGAWSAACLRFLGSSAS